MNSTKGLVIKVLILSLLRFVISIKINIFTKRFVYSKEPMTAHINSFWPKESDYKFTSFHSDYAKRQLKEFNGTSVEHAAFEWYGAQALTPRLTCAENALCTVNLWFDQVWNYSFTSNNETQEFHPGLDYIPERGTWLVVGSNITLIQYKFEGPAQRLIYFNAVSWFEIGVYENLYHILGLPVVKRIRRLFKHHSIKLDFPGSSPERFVPDGIFQAI